MSTYDVFDEYGTDDSIFANKGALDPLAKPDEIVACADQKRRLVTILNGVHLDFSRQ